MELIDLVPLVGGISGFIALLGIAVMFGTYRERIDRHERLLNILVQEGLALSWMQGRLRGMGNPSFSLREEMLKMLPPDVHECCRGVSTSMKLPQAYHLVAGRVLERLGNDRIADLATEFDATPLETLGVLVAYTMSLLRDGGR